MSKKHIKKSSGFEDTKLRYAIDFAIRYAKHPRRFGTPIQTPDDVAEKITSEIIGREVVEFGPGFGAVTFKIIQRLEEDSHDWILHCFEVDRACYKKLDRRITDSRVKLYNRSAEYLEFEVDDFDCIVSGLPLSSIEKPRVKRILESSQKAKRFIQYKYFPSDKILENYFKNIREERAGIHVIYVCEP